MRCPKQFYALLCSMPFYWVVAKRPQHKRMTLQQLLQSDRSVRKQTPPAAGRKRPIPMAYKRHGISLKATVIVIPAGSTVSGSTPTMPVNMKVVVPDRVQNYE